MPEQINRLLPQASQLLQTDINADLSSWLRQIRAAWNSSGEKGELPVSTAQPEGPAFVCPDAYTLLTEKILRSENLAAHFYPTGTAEEQTPKNAEETSHPESGPTVPALGTIIMKYDEGDTVFPSNYTMDHISLGSLDTVTPVMGPMTSGYGYRDHPISGKYLFHGGTDIAGKQGDPIYAFADGTVDYIGKSDTFGLYMQLDHGNGIKSFYAHCSKLCTRKGERVGKGEKIAEIGSTGVSTGPHLHLELKYNGLHLNPAYYVEFTGHDQNSQI